jgi:hypothetical protein
MSYFTNLPTVNANSTTTQTLVVSGNANLGVAGNVTITGGSTGQLLTTTANGSLSFVNPYSNANVDNYLPT